MRFIPLILLLSVFTCSVPVMAQQGRDPLIVTADGSLSWDRGGNRFTAKGNAVATQGSASLRGARLVAHYAAQNGRQSVSRIDASGDVVFRDGDSSVTGQTGFYDIESGFAEIRGGDLRLVNGKDVVTARDRMTYNALARELKAFGNAVAVRGDDRLRGDVLTARFKPARDGGVRLWQIEAGGHVRIDTPTESITGARALYDAATNIATMEGNVVITQGQNKLTGGRGQVNLNTNISTLFADESDAGASPKRVKGVFFPK